MNQGPGLWPAIGNEERRAFEFYFHQVAPALSPIFESEFWRGTVLQICRVEPAVCDAIVSMSALYELPSVAGCLSPDPAGPVLLKRSQHESHRRALAWYSRSLRAMQERIESGQAGRSVALVSCSLFIVIEILQGNWTAARALYHQGVQLIAKKVHGVTSTSSSANTSIASVLMRMGTLILIIAGVPLASPVSLSPTDCPITSVAEAKTALYTIIARYKEFDWKARKYLDGIYCTHGSNRSSGSDQIEALASLKSEEQCLITLLNDWDWRFSTIPAVARFMSCHAEIDGVKPSHTDASFIATLLMAHKQALILTKTSLVMDEMAFDRHNATYAEILALGPVALQSRKAFEDAQPLFGFEMECGLPFFVMVARCRDPQLRRKALEYLLKASPMNGSQMAVPAARVAAAIIELEESCISRLETGCMGLTGELSPCGRVPGTGERVSEFRLVPEESGIEVRYSIWYKRLARQAAGRWRMVEDSKPLPDRYTMRGWISAF